MFDFAKIKTQVRRVVHETLAVRVFYKDSTMSEPVEARARWHNKIDTMGDLENSGYAVSIEGIDRVVFSAVDARTINVKRGGEVWFSEYGAGLGAHMGSPMGGEEVGPPAFVLQARDPNSGPYEEVWEVTRKVWERLV